MSVRLKPCPFCKGEAEFERMGTRRQSCIVACQWCGCRLESNEEGDRCGEQWNTRAAPEEKPLSREWREEAHRANVVASKESALGHMTLSLRQAGAAGAFRKCAADLDASREEDRELLRELERFCAHVASNSNNCCLEASRYYHRIRNHLGGESDD